eukprot:XP_015576256.1 auxilin-like protein 1 [Ricinus communis]
MENPSHSRQPNMLSKKSCNGSSNKSIYDDVFGGPPRFGAPTLSPRVEDYSEIFGGFHSSTGSSIPVLDLPLVDDDAADVFFDVRSSGFDYAEVFGGYNGHDFGLSFDELMMMDQSNGHADSSDDEEAWTPADADNLSEESDHSAKDQCLSNGDSHESIDDGVEFNISYNKASQRVNEDLSNGVVHITQHHDVSGYTFVVDKTTSLPAIDNEYQLLQESDDDHLSINCSGEMLRGRHLKKVMSHPANGSTGELLFGNDMRPHREFFRNSSLPSQMFVTISDVSLRTQPSDLPPPSRPPPAFDNKKGGSGKATPSCKSATSEETTGDCSPPYFDVEVDASSSAAVSAAAMKEAMEKAQAKLKSAKESMDRKREGFQTRTKSVSKNERKDEEDEVSKLDNGCASRNTMRGQVSYREESELDYSISEKQNIKKITQLILESIGEKNHLNVVKVAAEENNGRESLSSQGSDSIDGAGEWKEATQFFELVTNKPRKLFGLENNHNILVPDSNFHQHGKEKKKETVEAMQRLQENDKKVKAVRADNQLKEYPKASQMSKEAFDCEIISGKSEEANKLKVDKKVQVAQEASRQVANEKKFETYWQPVETDKKQTRPDVSLKHESSLEVQQKESTSAVRQSMKHKEKGSWLKKGDRSKGDVKIFTCEQEDSERGQRKTFELEENEKMLTLSLEQAENERTLKKTPDQEEKEKMIKAVRKQEEYEKLQREAYEREENDRRLKEALEEEEKGRRMKETREKEERLRRQRETLKWQENEKREIEAREREENERKKREAREREESEKKLKKAVEKEEKERRLKETLEKEERQRRLREAVEQEENAKKEREEYETRKEALEKEERQRRRREAVEREENVKREREQNEKRLKEAAEWEENLKREREQNEKRLKGAREEEENKRRLEVAVEQEENEKRQRKSGERAKNENKQKEAYEREESEMRCKEASEKEEIEQRIKEVPENEVGERMEEVSEQPENYTTSRGAQEVKGSKPAPKEDHNPEEIGELTQAGSKWEESQKLHVDGGESGKRKGLSKHERNSEIFEATVEIPFGEISKKFTELRNGEKEAASGIVQGNLEHGRSQSPMEDVTGIEQKTNEKTRSSFQVNPDIGNQGKKFANERSERGINTEPAQVPLNQGNNKDILMSARAARESAETGRKMEGAQPAILEVKGSTSKTAQQVNATQSTERNVKTSYEAFLSEDKEAERLKTERELEREHLRKIEEEKEREREREKDRMAVDRAALETRERGFAEARERAERAAVERATAEARQRALNEARERLEKACAEAREKTLPEKASAEARLRAERAAVERATAEARERAFEKAMAERAAFEARERIERSVSDKFSSSSRNVGMRPSSSSSDLQDLQSKGTGPVSGSKYQYPSACTEGFEGVEGESAQRCRARLERYRRTAERAAKALAEKNMRDLLAQREQAERNRLAETLDADVKRWSSGKEGNLRALLSTLQYILGPNSGWQPIPLTEVITAAAVKKAYRKATLCVHPDKLQQRGASIQQKYICEKVFDLLKEAWNKFNSEER